MINEKPEIALNQKSAWLCLLALVIIINGYSILSYTISSIHGLLLTLLCITGVAIYWLIPLIPFIALGIFLQAIITSAIIDSRRD
jgi:hypothetical protein